MEGTTRIAIATPSANAWSETFIAAHLQRLHDVRCVLVDGVLPDRVLDGPVLLARAGNARAMDHLRAKLRGTDVQGLLRARIAQVLRARKVEVLLAEYGTCAHALLDPCAKAGVPLVAHFHGFDAHKESAIKETGSYQRLFREAAALVVVSNAMEEQLLALGAPREKVVLVRYGVDVERFATGAPAQAPAHFVAVGRFVDKKAPHLVLDAFERMLVKVPTAMLTMVGQGPLWESCHQRVRATGLAERVQLVGVKKPEEVAAIMRGARAFVQHSVRAMSGDSEGTPLAVLEAMATGIPVVATRHTGIGEVVTHGVNGLLCDEFDVATMAEHLVRMATDGSEAGRLGHAARVHAEEHFRVQDSIAKLQAVLERVVRN